MELSIREGSEVPAFIMQGEELRVRFDYKVTGSLPRTKITTFYRFDGAGSWKSSSETTVVSDRMVASAAAMPSLPRDT